MIKEFEMSEEQLIKLHSAMRPGHMIMLQCGPALSLQERANFAWEELGKEMGFLHMTVKPSLKGPRFFTAEATEQNNEVEK